MGSHHFKEELSIIELHFIIFNSCIFTNSTKTSICVNVFQSTLDKPVSRSVTPAGNCTVLSMESSLMVKCQVTKPLEVEMIPSTPSSVKLELENTFHEPFSSILNQLLSMRFVPELTVNFSTLNNLSLERKMPPTTTPVVTTPSEKKLSTWSWIVSESLPINVLVSKDF